MLPLAVDLKDAPLEIRIFETLTDNIPHINRVAADVKDYAR